MGATLNLLFARPIVMLGPVLANFRMQFGADSEHLFRNIDRLVAFRHGAPFVR